MKQGLPGMKQSDFTGQMLNEIDVPTWQEFLYKVRKVEIFSLE